MTQKVDVNKLRFKDWAEIESLTGKAMGWWISELGSGMANVKADDLVALVWVAGKRFNPSFTREEANELGPSDLSNDVDPTESDAGSPASPPSATSGA